MNYESEIHAIMMQLQGLNLRDKDDRAKQAELLEEMDRLESLEAVPDRVELVESEQLRSVKRRAACGTPRAKAILAELREVLAAQSLTEVTRNAA